MTKTEIQTRIEYISHRMLDVAGNIVDTIGQGAAMRVKVRAQIEAALHGEIAAFTCRKAACRRARRCRGEPFHCIERARAEARELNGGP